VASMRRGVGVLPSAPLRRPTVQEIGELRGGNRARRESDIRARLIMAFSESAPTLRAKLSLF